MSTTLEPANDIEEHEVRRLSQRQGIKKRLAEMEIHSDRIVQLRHLVATLDLEDNEARAEHAAATAEIDAALNKIDQTHIDNLLTGKVPPADASAKRRELLGQQQAIDSALESTVAANAKSRDKLTKQIDDLRLGLADESVLKNRLAGELTTDESREKSFLLDQRSRYAVARLQAAKKTIEDLEQELRIARNPGLYKHTNGKDYDAERLTRRLATWRIEEADAQQWVDAIAEEQREHRAKMLAE